MTAQALLGDLDLKAYPYLTERKTSMGSWVPILSTQSSAFLDGGVVTGDMTANREIILSVLISAGSRAELAQASEALVSQANQPSNTLTLISDGVPAQVYETYRASSVTVVEGVIVSPVQRMYEIHLPARPFVRSLARQQAVASPPTVSLDDMELSAPGVAMGRQVPGVGLAGNNTMGTGAPVVDPTVPLLSRLKDATVQGSALTVTGGTRVDGTANLAGNTVPVSVVTASAAGVVQIAAAAPVAVSGVDYVTSAWAVQWSAAPYRRAISAGVQWLDGAGSPLRMDWGPSITVGPNQSPWTAWQASDRPAAAVSARAVMRWTAVGAGELIRVAMVTLAASAIGTVASTTPGHDGSGSAQVSVRAERDMVLSGSSAYWEHYGPVYISRRLPAAVDVSSQVRIRGWMQVEGDVLGPAALRLWDAAGNWSRWDMAQSLPKATWVQIAADLASPSESSSTPCDLTHVAAWDLLATQDMSSTTTDPIWLTALIDSLTVGPADSPTLSPRGTVLTLEPIQGSARTTAALQVSCPVPMTDWLVACIDGTQGDPLLAIAANSAVGSGYDGTYSVLVGMAPAAAPANPTLVVSQKVGATVVATRTLTGIVREGSRYVDYGAVELPLRRAAAENADVTYTFTLSPAASQYADLLVIDVNASMMWVPSLPTPRRYGWVDEPSPTSSMGPLYVGDMPDRSDAIATIGPPVPGRPLHVSGPSTRLMPYSTSGAPSAVETYWPRWGAEALL